MTADLPTARSHGWAQDSGDEPVLAVEYDDGLEAVLIVMGVEEAELLVTMGGVERVVDVQHDAPRHLTEAGTVEIDHGTPYAHQGTSIRSVLQA